MNLIKGKELENYYNFNKGDLIEGDIKQIIEKRNRDLNEKKIPATPENYFYLIENIFLSLMMIMKNTLIGCSRIK